MSKKLVIVESPAKAKTIEKILGSSYSVQSSYGHVRDLIKGNKAIDIEGGFKPTYVVSPEKKKVVSKLKEAMKKSDDIILATDEDREGEAISWHLCEVLGLDPATTDRIVFREITKPAIKKAIESPRRVDTNLVNAQQARRILDRLVGFELSEVLWRKVKGKLSAGRVQSVAVKLIVDREREINAFESEAYFKVKAVFDVTNDQGQIVKLEAEIPKKLANLAEAKNLLEACQKSTFTIDDIQVKPATKRPAPPFTTSTLQQDASRKLGFAVKRTMQVAQRLYENGHITYMRTDSTNLSQTAIGLLADEIHSAYGANYHKSRQFGKKSELAQEAHEAIRPTHPENHRIEGDRDQERLYDLIWKRTIASQMADAKLEKTQVKISASETNDHQFVANGEVLVFDGFLKVYMASKDDDEQNDDVKGILPPLKVGQSLALDHITSRERFSAPPARYTEAGLVKKMEELGIGRPSTYAPTITKIMEENRGYVVKDSRDGKERTYRQLKLSNGQIQETTETEISGVVKNRLFPSDIGMLVSDFLTEHFTDVMSYGFTAKMEENFDHIAAGKRPWNELLKEFYFPFHENVEKTKEEAERVKGARILGKDPETGYDVIARISRFGKPMIQIGDREEVKEDEKPRFANLKVGQSIETITMEEAMELFKLPVELGEHNGHPVSVHDGRYGPYVKYGDTFISLPKGEDPLEVDMTRAEELIKEKLKADEPVTTYKDLPVTKGKGRFGPYLLWNKIYVNIPRRFDPETLTESEMHELIKVKEEKEANRYIHQWPEEKISVENGRWGPFIRFKRKSISIPKKDDGKRVTSEEAKEWTLEQVKDLIEQQVPGSFKAKKKKASPKKK